MICESVQPPLSPSVMLQSPSKKHHRKIFNESKEEIDPTYDMEYYNDVEKLQCCDPPIIVSEYSSSDYSIDNIRSQAIQDPEIDEVSLIERSYEKGNHQVRMVYAFRSVSRAIPDIVSCLASFANLKMILRQHPYFDFLSGNCLFLITISGSSTKSGTACIKWSELFG
jgi:hypothetical protein